MWKNKGSDLLPGIKKGVIIHKSRIENIVTTIILHDDHLLRTVICEFLRQSTQLS